MPRKICIQDGCDKQNFKFKYCLKHLQDAVDRGEVEARLCRMDDGKVAVGGDLCSMHYTRQKKGIPLEAQKGRYGNGHMVNGYTMCKDDNGKWVLEHRYVMSQILGRPLESHETVHHINGDRTDNRPENLQLRQGRHGKGAVFACNDCGSNNVSALPLA